VTELTYLLFLKMAKETGTEAGIPEEWRWDELEPLMGLKQLEHYKLLLLELGSSSSGSSMLVQEIFANASRGSRAAGLSGWVRARARLRGGPWGRRLTGC
jgi:hypothetical protein